MFPFAPDWSKHSSWPNREYSSIFKSCVRCEKDLKDNENIASIWGENIIWYLSSDIICSLKLRVFIELRSERTVRFSGPEAGTDNVSEQIS